VSARAGCLAVLGALAALVAPTGALASGTQESTFQDDDLLVYGTEAVQASTLDTIKALGGDRVRVTLQWRLVAPEPDAAAKPAGFDGSNPAAYPPGAWDRYDRLVRLAKARGLGVNLDVTAPAPNWGTGTPPDRPDLDSTFDPSAAEFGAFVRAAAVRYPGVHYWSIWNEPNQAGWLTPQWLPDPRDPTRWVPTAPQVYRRLLDAAWTSLQQTGHGHDTILVGETAPKGLLQARGVTRSMDSQRFIRELYCLDDNLQFYKGTSAEVRACPTTNQAAGFVAAHPALFGASGWAHHPYELTFAPDRPPVHRDAWVTIANLHDLGGLLRRIRARYRQPTRAAVPLYLTEFGYQTKPPDPLGVTFAQQAEYLNQAEYIAWRNGAVRTLAQFLLVDSGPPYGVTFQSGLRTADRKPKPAYDAYALPVWLPSPTIRNGRKLKVWGLARAAPAGRHAKVSIQVRVGGRGHPWRRVATATASAARGYLTASVPVHRSGELRLVWNGHRSRVASFRVRGGAARR
jgi:hypothetical protein